MAEFSDDEWYAEEAEAPGPGDVIDERFELEQFAGRGAMAEVFRARDRSRDERVAVKLIHEPTERGVVRFEREVQVLAALSHPGIVSYVAHGTTGDGQRYIAMEWLEGVSLQQRLKTGSLGVAASVSLVRRAAEAIGAAHERAIVHRDVKPANLFLVEGRADEVKVLDFGIARLTHAERITQAGQIVGTPRYMSPEQAAAAHSADARTDVFALGCVLFECLTGRYAYDGVDFVSVMAKILFEDAPRVGQLRAGVPPAVQDVVARMLDRNADSRPPDGVSLAEQLAALGELAAADPVPRSEQPRSLSGLEQRVVSVIVTGATAVSRTGTVDVGSVQTAAEFGVRLETLANGAAVAVIADRAVPADLAMRAARCALALRAPMGDVPVVLATGLGVVRRGVPLGRLIDGAVELLAQARPDAVVLDDVSAGLLDARFVLERTKDGVWLLDERPSVALTDTFVSQNRPFVGREDELATLDASFRRCIDQQDGPRAVSLCGEAGIGKSRLAYEALGRLGAEPQVWIARGDPVTTRSPFGALGAMVRRVAGVAPTDAAALQRQKLSDRLSRDLVMPEALMESFVAELASVPFEVAPDSSLAMAREDPELLAEQIQWAWVRWLGLECAKRPLVILVDDAQWVDLPSIRLLGVALERLAQEPLWVLAVGRPEATDRLAEQWPEERHISLQVEPLGADGAAQFVRQVLGMAVTSELVGTVVERAAGNALYLEELVRAHQLGRGDDLPTNVLGMVQGRLDTLSAEAKRVLRAASIYGHEFCRAGVEVLLPKGLCGPALQGWLDELAARELVVVSEGGQGRMLCFRQAVVRDTAYAMLTKADRRLGHRLAAEWLQTTPSPDPRVVAEHYELAGEAGSAIAHYLCGALRAVDSDDHDEAFDCAERGVRCGAASSTLGALLWVQSRVKFRLARLAEARELAQRALQLHPRGTAAWFRSLSVLVRADAAGGDQKALWQWTDQLREAEPQDPEAIVSQLEALCWAAPMELRAGQPSRADELLARADALATRVVHLEPLTEARLFYAQGVRALYRGSLTVAKRCFECCCDSYEQVGHRYRLCVARGNLGLVLVQLGHWAPAVTTIGAALGLADETGKGYLAASVRINLAMALCGAGQLEEARARVVEALTMAEGLGHRLLEADARLTLAMVVLRAGLITQAWQQAAAAVQISEPFPSLHVRALAVLARCHLALGMPQEACQAASRGMELVAAGTEMEEGEAELRLVYAQTLGATGDGATAAQAFAEARARLLERAERIQSEADRESFLTQVPENAQTMG